MLQRAGVTCPPSYIYSPTSRQFYHRYHLDRPKSNDYLASSTSQTDASTDDHHSNHCASIFQRYQLHPELESSIQPRSQLQLSVPGRAKVDKNRVLELERRLPGEHSPIVPIYLILPLPRSISLRIAPDPKDQRGRDGYGCEKSQGWQVEVPFDQ